MNLFVSLIIVRISFTRSKSIGNRIDVVTGEGTSKTPPMQANQSEAQAEYVLETSSTPEELRRRRTTSSEPPINANDQDLKNTI